MRGIGSAAAAFVAALIAGGLTALLMESAGAPELVAITASWVVFLAGGMLLARRLRDRGGRRHA